MSIVENTVDAKTEFQKYVETKEINIERAF